ncbi:restin homolog isoform X2 [Manduca sexta]|uniref:restin homolog isoform X2 n=1 Tax=Manduca sexta TaxID=7130 RepID=UPI00188F00E9|nr:restin homolog isoform X2 [Manduca sexta]
MVDDELKEKESEGKESLPPKSIPVEEASFSTLTTDYKTICEEYHGKLVHLEDAITQRDQLIEELTVSLQRSVRERDDLRDENHHLTNEVQHLQHVVGEMSHTEHDTIKAQLSDFVKYQSMVKDETKFYSALMSGESSVQTSNSEKDMDREEITVNYSKSDLKSSETSDDFQTGFESKITKIIDTFDECIEENLRNKLRESLIQVLCDEIGKMRIEYDTDIKELETQVQQDKQAFTVETRRLEELLASVKSGNSDIEALREELAVKHEKEMENLRTYFEKKCSDMERSYSEEVWRGKCQSPLGSASSLDGAADAAGDYFRRRTRSAELPSLSLESTPMEQAARQISKKYEQQIDEMKAEHVAYVNELQDRQREAIASLEDQVTQLKAHMQTTENTEANVSLYQQDIDLELEKKMEAQLEQRLEEAREHARRDVVAQLEEQLQVLLSDPDAEVSSWPLELVALRDRIQGDCKTRDEREVSSLRDEVSACEDKWKQRRNHSFDQNRHLEEVTRERDDLKRVAVSLHRVVGQLVAYCACAEDELNRTVLTQLLGRLLPGGADESILEEEFRPSTPSLLGELDASAVSRGGKHVHFAPDLKDILSDLDEECVVGFVQRQRDLSADIKRELEQSLRRLRLEAHSLLDLSAKLAAKGKSEQKMLESSVSVTELVQELDDNKTCDNCELHRKTMEEAMAECLQRENLLRSDLEAAMIKIAQLMTSADVIAEGYGTGGQVHSPQSRRSRGDSPRSLDSPGAGTDARELDALQRERDDLHQQLEAANRQLRSTRQFVEEQASEREAERDEFARALADLRDENTRLAARLHNNARILNEMHCLRLAKCNCREHDAHVEQLEAQTREMNQIINELETRKVQTDDELKANEEKIVLLRDIIANLEGQLEQKTSREKEILEELEEMKRTIDERDGRMRGLLSELESLRNEKADQSEVVCSKCGLEEEKYTDLLQRIKEQCHWLEEAMHRRTRKLEHLHEVCSTSCSEPSEDVSIRDQKNMQLEWKSEESVTPRACGGELRVVWEALGAHGRAEDAVLKRLADLEMQRNSLKDLAQEVRAERDVLQARMSEQALKISSLSARLQQQRNDAEALSHQATSQLTVQLHDALAEVQRLKEELDSKDKQLTRLKQHVDERDRLQEQHHSLYGNSCNPKDKVMILERELSSAQTRIAQLESLARSLEKDKEDLQTSIRDHQRELAEKEEQLQELLALKLDEDNHKDENDAVEGKTSARTLSDIVSISEFDEQDLQMRRAEIKAHNVSLTDAPYPTELRDKTLNRHCPQKCRGLI